MRSLSVWMFLTGSMLLAADGDSTITGPVSGVLYDSESRALRPVLGVPGAAWLGAPLLPDADSGSVAPNGSVALAMSGGQLLLGVGLTGIPSWNSLDATISDVDRFAWSETAAALYSSTTKRAQVIRKVFRTPNVTEAIDLASLSGKVTAIALAGESLVVAVESEEGGGIYLVQADNTLQLLASAGAPRALTISGSDLYYADRENGVIWQIPNCLSNSTPILFAAGIEDPVGMEVASGRLLVASASTRQLRVYDSGTRAELMKLDLEFEPAGLSSAGMPSQLLLARGIAGQQPYYLLDISQAPAVYFVPGGAWQQ